MQDVSHRRTCLQLFSIFHKLLVAFRPRVADCANEQLHRRRRDHKSNNDSIAMLPFGHIEWYDTTGLATAPQGLWFESTMHLVETHANSCSKGVADVCTKFATLVKRLLDDLIIP